MAAKQKSKAWIEGETWKDIYVQNQLKATGLHKNHYNRPTRISNIKPETEKM